MTRLRTAAIIAMTAAAAAMLAAGCSSESDAAPLPTIGLGSGQVVELDAVDGTAQGATSIESVVMIGDSITKGATPALQQRFADLGLPVEILAENGKRMTIAASNNPSGAELAEFVAADEARDHSTEVWVVALGTNDAGQYGSPDEIAGAVNDVLDRVPDESPVVWVDTYIANRADDTNEANDIIRDRVERRGNSVVVPWSDVAGGDGVLLGDAVHPTAAGYDLFSTLVAEAVRTFLGR